MPAVPAAQRAWRACQGSGHVAISCCRPLKGEEQPGARSTPGLASAGARPHTRMMLSLLLWFSPAQLSQRRAQEEGFPVGPQQKTGRLEL